MVELEDSYALGLDLGTTFSCIGAYQNGEVEIIPNRNGERITPSIVTIIDKDTILKGEESLEHLVKNYDSSIYAIKRFIGREFKDKEVQEDIKKENFPFKIVGDKEGKNPLIEVTKNNEKLQFTLEEISSFVIKKMVENAESFLNRKVSKLVITVPANFNNAQRECTRQAALLANIEVLRIINEPTAAALAYGLQDKEKTTNGKILVFDLGGGTFDVSILTISKTGEENLEILSTNGDKFLGGEDFDNKLVNYFLDNFCRKMEENKEEILKDKKLIKKLKISCENIKRVLSTNYSTILTINKFYNQKDMNETINRKEFEEMCEDLFERLKIPLGKALIDAKLTSKDISEIVLVGGSTRIPKIKTFLKEYFGDKCKINDSINPDETVAYGATLMAAKISIKRDKTLAGFNLMDITPLSLGVAVKNNSKNKDILKEGLLMSVIIKRTSNIPCNNSDIYSTSSDNQTSASIEIYEGEKKYVKYNHILGKLLLNNLPPRPKGEVKIKVKFFIDANGILNVTASELSKDQKEEIKSIEAKIEYQSFGLDNEKIEKLKIKNKKYYEKCKNLKTDYSNIREALKEYKDALSETNDDEDIYNILMNYNNTYEEFIDSFNKDFDNETVLEKYYLFMKELFESYVKISNNKNISKDEKNEIIEKIKNYIKIFTEKSSGYLNNLLETLKELPKAMFFEIIIYTMELMNKSGKKCLEERKKFCKYNSLMYFEKAYSLFNKYIIEISKCAVCPKETKENLKKQLEICLLYINEIKTGAILLLEDSVRTGKLISSGTGFTKSIIGLNFSKEDSKEKYELVLQNYEKMLREFPSNNENIEGKNKKNSLPKSKPTIQEAICIANIIKISYSFLGNTNYKRLYKLCERCEFITNNFEEEKKNPGGVVLPLI